MRPFANMQMHLLDLTVELFFFLQIVLSRYIYMMILLLVQYINRIQLDDVYLLRRKNK